MQTQGTIIGTIIQSINNIPQTLNNACQIHQMHTGNDRKVGDHHPERRMFNAKLQQYMTNQGELEKEEYNTNPVD